MDAALMGNVTEFKPPKPGIKPDKTADEIRSEFCTDSYAATVFAEMFGSGVRWVPGWGWLYWNGQRWSPDVTGEIIEMAENVGPRFRSLAMDYDDPKIASKFYQHAKHVQSHRGIQDFLRLSQHRVSAFVSDFDADPMLVNVNNATLNFGMIEGDLPNHRNHCDSEYITKIIPHDWNMGAPCPRWITFLKQILPSVEVRNFVQRAIGYSLLGTTRDQVFFVAYGSGANGKSTFLNTLQRVIGTDYASQADPRSFMAERSGSVRSDLARLAGVRFLSAIETGDGKRLNEPLVKAMTGGDKIVAAYKFKNEFEFTPQFKLWICTNHKPEIRGTDHAIWRRIRLIPFEVRIPEAEQDRDLDSLLFREAEGILNWCVEGAVQYMKEGLQPPAEVVAASEAYRREEDALGEFLAECCVLNGDMRVSASKLGRL